MARNRVGLTDLHFLYILREYSLEAMTVPSQGTNGEFDSPYSYHIVEVMVYNRAFKSLGLPLLYCGTLVEGYPIEQGVELVRFQPTALSLEI